MKRLFEFTLVLLGIVLLFSSCVNGRGEVVVETMEFGAFTKIDHNIKGDVIIVNDQNHFVEVHGQQNVLDAITISNDNGTLKIRTKGGKSIGKYEELTYYVHMSLLEEVKIGGKGTVKGSNITGNKFITKISNDGKLEIDGIDADKVEAIIAGAGQMVLEGKTDKCELGVGSVGLLSAYELIARESEVELRGNGVIETYAIEKLTVFLLGNGTIYYKGNPTVKKEKHTAGILIHRQ